jgi:hypothetical protein
VIFGRSKQVTCNELIDRYANVLERGPKGSGTLHSIADLPAEKPLMKAALIARAYELGPGSIETLQAAFLSLAHFQVDTAEPPRKHFEIAAEMTVLAMEWAARTKSLSEPSDA